MPDEQIYRQESLDYHAGHVQEGEVLLMLPRWMRWVHYVVVALVVSTLAFLVVGSVPQYIPGPALLHESSPQDADTPPIVAVLIPGWHRSDIALHQSVRIELEGFPHVYQHASVERIDDRSLSPDEVSQRFGAALANQLPATGPVVVVYARLERTAFQAHGRTYPFLPGMSGTARVRTHDERLLHTLLPSLRMFTDRPR